MTEDHAVAGATVARPPRGSFTAPARRGRLGRVSMGQIVTVQVAAVAAVATYPQPDAVFIPVLLAGVLLTAATFARRPGRWWYEDLLRRWRLRSRVRRASRSPAPSVREITDRGTRIGVGLDPAGFYTVLSVVAPDPDPSRRPELDRILAALDDVDAPVSAMQLVHHHVPLPTVGSAAGRQTWIGLRLDADDAAGEAASRGGGVDGVHRALTAAIGRVSKTLRADGLDCWPLTADQVTAAVAAVAGPPDGAPDTHEHWHGREAADATYVCFRMLGMFSLAEIDELLRDTSVLSYTLSVRMLVSERRDGAGPPRHGLLQIAAGAGMLNSTVAEVTALARRVGCRLQRLDGWHGPGAYATAPTGAPPANR
jgi:type VII secretion protein EccE